MSGSYKARFSAHGELPIGKITFIIGHNQQSMTETCHKCKPSDFKLVHHFAAYKDGNFYLGRENATGYLYCIKSIAKTHVMQIEDVRDGKRGIHMHLNLEIQKNRKIHRWFVDNLQIYFVLDTVTPPQEQQVVFID